MSRMEFERNGEITEDESSHEHLSSYFLRYRGLQKLVKMRVGMGVKTVTQKKKLCSLNTVRLVVM